MCIILAFCLVFIWNDNWRLLLRVRWTAFLKLLPIHYVLQCCTKKRLTIPVMTLFCIQSLFSIIKTVQFYLISLEQRIHSNRLSIIFNGSQCILSYTTKPALKIVLKAIYLVKNINFELTACIFCFFCFSSRISNTISKVIWRRAVRMHSIKPCWNCVQNLPRLCWR